MIRSAGGLSWELLNTRCGHSPLIFPSCWTWRCCSTDSTVTCPKTSPFEAAVCNKNTTTSKQNKKEALITHGSDEERISLPIHAALFLSRGCDECYTLDVRFICVSEAWTAYLHTIETQTARHRSRVCLVASHVCLIWLRSVTTRYSGVSIDICSGIKRQKGFDKNFIQHTSGHWKSSTQERAARSLGMDVRGSRC